NTMVRACNAVVMMRSSCVPRSFTQRSELSLQSRTDRCSLAGSSVVSRHVWRHVSRHTDLALSHSLLHSCRRCLTPTSDPSIITTVYFLAVILSRCPDEGDNG